MDTIQITLPQSKKIVSVLLDRKNMKTCRLKVFPDQSIVLSLPKTVPSDWVQSFLEEKSPWIEEKMAIFQKTVGYAATNEIRNGYSIKMLGEDMIFIVTPCDKDYVFSEGKTIHICCKTPEDQNHVKNLFEKWWRQKAKEIIEERLQHWFPVVEKYGIPFPKITIKKMKTLWGSCSPARNSVTFNFYLIKARIPYIDYVVLHEIIHFLYPNHSKFFYDFLSNYMPDWKDRKKVLDQDVVHGL